MDLSHWREDYDKYSIHEESLPIEPYSLFENWFEKASEDKNPEPNAFVLTTSSSSRAHSRMVLLKEIEDNQFIFYTNYQSQKGRDIDKNPSVSMLFFWPFSQRQIRIYGVATKLSRDKAIEYFKSRPIESQISAISSPQSTRISKEQLVNKTIQVAKLGQMECPDHWGGYGILPIEFEFWQGQPARLHDRIVYKKTNESQWEMYRLAP